MSFSTQAQKTLDSLNSISTDNFVSDAERIQIKQAATNLVARLEKPWETITNITMFTPVVLNVWRVASDLAMFHKWYQDSAESKKSTSELAKMTGCDEALMRRLLHVLERGRLLTSHGPDCYTLTSLGKEISHPPMDSAIGFWSDLISPGLSFLPEHLKSLDYASPTTTENTAWHKLAKVYGNTDQDIWTWMHARPYMLKDFQTIMAHHGNTKAAWTELFPADELVRTAKPDRPVLVDVGGGTGSDIGKLAYKHENMEVGRFVVQDRGDVVKLSQLKKPVKGMEHDFFQPQPIKGARAYYLHAVLHDWPDEECTQILRNISAVMENEYSTLLIHDGYAREGAQNPMAAISDVMMMAFMSGCERTADDFDRLAKSAGLRVKKIWTDSMAYEGVVECELA